MRQRVALALCVIWIISFELMPWMHVAMHEHLAPHSHDASGAVILGEAPHDHGDGEDHVHTHVYPRPPAAHHHHHHADDLTRLAGALAHGAHSLEHHGIAVPTPSAVWLSPLPVDRRPTYVEVVAIIAPVSIESVRAVARGPPSGAIG